MAAAVAPSEAPKVAAPSAFLQYDEMSKAAERVEKIYRGIGFDRLAPGSSSPEELFQKWRWKEVKDVLKDLMLKQNAFEEGWSRIMSTLKKDILIADKVLPSLSSENEKRSWLAFRHAAIKIKYASFLEAREELSGQLERSEISHEDYIQKCSDLARLQGEPEEDAFVEPSYRELFVRPEEHK